MGSITFIHHEKKYATIEYLVNGKKKTINGNIDASLQLKLKENKSIKKIHHFRIGDEVSFELITAPKGDRMIAQQITFRFNNAYTNLISKAAVENKFVGYLKKLDEEYFVKETGSYIQFPLKLSPWEKAPHESRLNEPVFFKLENLEKPDHLTAALYQSEYLPEYLLASRHFKNQTPITGKVYKITPFGIFVQLFNDKIQAKIGLSGSKSPNTTGELQLGDLVEVMITYLSPFKIVVEKAS